MATAVLALLCCAGLHYRLPEHAGAGVAHQRGRAPRPRECHRAGRAAPLSHLSAGPDVVRAHVHRPRHDRHPRGDDLAAHSVARLPSEAGPARSPTRRATSWQGAGVVAVGPSRLVVDGADQARRADGEAVERLRRPGRPTCGTRGDRRVRLTQVRRCRGVRVAAAEGRSQVGTTLAAVAVEAHITRRWVASRMRLKVGGLVAVGGSARRTAGRPEPGLPARIGGGGVGSRLGSLVRSRAAPPPQRLGPMHHHHHVAAGCRSPRGSGCELCVRARRASLGHPASTSPDSASTMATASAGVTGGDAAIAEHVGSACSLCSLDQRPEPLHIEPAVVGGVAHGRRWCAAPSAGSTAPAATVSSPAVALHRVDPGYSRAPARSRPESSRPVDRQPVSSNRRADCPWWSGVPGKGRGAFANRPIAAGELLERAPVLVLSFDDLELEPHGARRLPVYWPLDGGDEHPRRWPRPGGGGEPLSAPNTRILRLVPERVVEGAPCATSRGRGAHLRLPLRRLVRRKVAPPASRPTSRLRERPKCIEMTTVPDRSDIGRMRSGDRPGTSMGVTLVLKRQQSLDGSVVSRQARSRGTVGGMTCGTKVP